MKTVIEIDHATHEVVVTGAIEGRFVLREPIELVTKPDVDRMDIGPRLDRVIAQPPPIVDLALRLHPLPRPGYGWHFSYNGAIL